MTSSRRCAIKARALAGWLALGVASLATSPALAQRTAVDVETARELYNKGRELRESGDLPGALEKLKAAHALARTPITGLELARTHAALGQPVEAREVCLGIARTPVTAEETPRSAEARAAAAQLAEDVKPKIATLSLRIKGAPPGAEASLVIDGSAVPAAALGQPRQVNPGTHAFVARVGRGPETKGSVALKEGEVREVEVTVVAPREPPPPPELARGRPTEQRLSPLVIPGFTVAAVGVTVGAVTGILALSGKSDVSSKCVASRCGPDAYDALDRARLMGNVSTVAFVVGALGAGVGIYGLTHPINLVGVASRSGSLQPELGPGYVGVHGVF